MSSLTRDSLQTNRPQHREAFTIRGEPIMARRIEQVVDAGLCIGCGACVERAGDRMALTDRGVMRPVFQVPLTRDESRLAVNRCPSVSLHLRPDEGSSVHPVWGPLIQVRTGWSTDAEIRYRGSSGGAISAMLVHLLQSRQVDFVAHVAASTDEPLRNLLVMSRTREEVLSGAGSRYAPAAPLEHAGKLFASGERFAFVGKPCDAAAIRAYVGQRPDLSLQLVLVVSFMCAGLPSIEGTREVIRALGADPSEVAHFQYRGNGWPGYATATLKDGRKLSMDYNRSWGQILGTQLQLRCKLCPDGTGEFADVVCADAWYGKDGYPDFNERDGRSLILTRTELGERMVQAAHLAGALEMQPARPEDIAAMQPYQLKRKQVVLGRWLAVFLRRGVRPRLSGLHLRRAQRRGGLMPAVRNAGGTFLRLSRTTDV